MNENIPMNSNSQEIPGATVPQTVSQPPVAPPGNSRFTMKRILAGVVALLLIAFGAYYFLYPSSDVLIAEVDGEKIYQKELEDTAGLFAHIDKKDKNDVEVKTKALNFAIEHRLLEKETQKRQIDTSKTVEKRVEASIAQYGSSSSLEKSLDTSIDVYTAYIQSRVIKENLEQMATQWKIIDYFSIRYLYDDNAPPAEAKYKEVVDRKIKEYYEKIINGLDIREAIAQRCKDPLINYLPYDQNNKIYTTTFNGTVCREQVVNRKVSKDTNPEWGDEWLKEIFSKTKKGEISPIIDHKDKHTGIYFIVKVLDEGGDTFSFEDLVQNLRKASTIKVYKQL